jgi:hypothetical protein
MLAGRILAILVPAAERLALHKPRQCDADPTHAVIQPELGCMDIEMNAVPDAAVYTCRADRCEWRRKDPLKR